MNADELRQFLKLNLETQGVNVEEFLNPKYENSHDPFLFSQVQKAVERIFKAIKDNEKIAIYADFDADGIPGAAILYEFFKRIGVDVFVYIPHRDKQGYGFHEAAIEELQRQNIKLIITVDVGVADSQTIKKALELGIDTIVTDHHEILDPENLQKHAYCIINPKAEKESYPFDGLCGAGVAFKLVQALSSYGRKKHPELFKDFKEGMEKWFLDLVAIATISDLVPLVDENRIFAKWGLYVLSKTYRPGLLEFYRQKRKNLSELDEDDVSFLLTPRINAASRMGDPYLAFRLLTTTSAFEARSILKELEKLNKSRQSKTASMVKELKKRLLSLQEIPDVIVLGDTEFSPSLCGLAASKLSEEFGKTVCIWGKDASGQLKGSCRSAGDVDIPELFSGAEDVLLGFGGHKMAGGFSVEPQNLHKLFEKLNTSYQKAKARFAGQSNLAFSLSLSLADDALKVLQEFAPFGVGNPKPEFAFEDLSVVSAKEFGNSHLEIEVSKAGAQARAFQFFSSIKPNELGKTVSFKAHLQKGYKNKSKAELKINSFLK